MNKEPRYCHKHKIEVFPFYSRNKEKNYWKHEYRDQNGLLKTCWVNSDEEMDAFREKQVDYGNDNKL
jgi:hypothetical protein